MDKFKKKEAWMRDTVTGSVQEEEVGSPGFSACIAECMGMQEEWQFVGCI